jgi:ferrous iron transport protein A
MKLTELKKQEKARVVSLQKLEKQFVQRLMDIGLYENANVTLLNCLSFGNLYLLEVDNIEICIRKKDAERIEVEQ